MKRIEVQQIKNKKILLISLIIVIIILIIQLILSKTKIININKKTIKEMSSTTQEIELNNQINALNTEHTEYANYIQECKAKIATALTNEGVPTSNEATLETMAENIEKILEGGNLEVLGGVALPQGNYVDFTISKTCHLYAVSQAFVTIAKNGVSISPELLTDSSVAAGIVGLYDIGEVYAGDVLTAMSTSVGTYAIHYFIIS